MAQLHLDEILRAGSTGRVETDDAAWVGALARLVNSANDEGNLSDAGAHAFAAKLATFVAERRRADELLLAHPEIGARALPVQTVVAGLARSGTTVLHRLLACDPDVSFLPTWQAFHPVPEGRTLGTDPRRDTTVAMIEAMRRDHPESFRIHPIDADAPEEEVFLLQLSFASMLFGLTCALPTYHAWLATTDHTDAYRFAFDVLRLNEWAADQPAGRPRVMKSPQYVLDLAVIDALLPDATIVQTHRDPVDLVGSYCSTYANARRRSVRDVDLHALGEERLEHLLTMLDRAAVARASAAPGRVLDIDYVDIVRRPVEVVERVWAHRGATLPGAIADRIVAWVADHPQDASGRHTYDLADYGLDRVTVEARFAAHLSRDTDET